MCCRIPKFLPHCVTSVQLLWPQRARPARRTGAASQAFERMHNTPSHGVKTKVPGGTALVIAKYSLSECCATVCVQIDFRAMLKCPVALREFSTSTSRRRSTLRQPISRINILDASLVQYSRSDRVRSVMPGTAHAAQRRHQPADVPVSMREHDVVDMKPAHLVDESYFHAPNLQLIPSGFSED